MTNGLGSDILVYTPGGRGYLDLGIFVTCERSDMQITLYVPDVSCNHCAMTIKRELAGVQGISGVEVDVAKKTVTFEYVSEQTLEQAKSVLADIGYPVAA